MMSILFGHTAFLLIILPASVVWAQTVPVYKRFEVCVEAETHYSNPFNYSEVAVRGKLTGPPGTDTVDGFYYQAYTRSMDGGHEKLTPQGQPQWCVRYAPREEGDYKMEVTITNSSGVFPVTVASFHATQAINAGYIKKSSNGIHFQFTNGSTYYLVGENVCWVTENGGTYDYDTYFGKLAQNGANYARLWLTDSSWDDLSVEVEVGKMSLENTWRLDYVIELAEKRSMHMLMCTESFNYFCTKSSAPCDWKICYYNVANGGFLTKPEDFFTNTEARMDYKNRLRYLVARYGYSTSVFAWEFFNEVDITDNYDSSVQVAWNTEMANYLHTIDIYGHLISNSYSNSDGDEKVQALSVLDFTMIHNYGSSDIAGDTAQYPYKKLMRYKKPSYVAEFGIGDESQDKNGVSLHNGVWAPLFSMAAGTCMTWWWDSWVNPNDLYHIFQPFAHFVSQLNLANMMWSSVQPYVNGTGLRVWGMVGESESEEEMMLAWVQDECFTWPNQHAGKQCQKRSSIQLTLPGCKHTSTAWVGYWYDTHTGQLITSKNVSCYDGAISDEVSTFMFDVAVYYSYRI